MAERDKITALAEKLAKHTGWHFGELAEIESILRAELESIQAEGRQESDELLRDASIWRNDCLHANAQVVRLEQQLAEARAHIQLIQQRFGDVCGAAGSLRPDSQEAYEKAWNELEEAIERAAQPENAPAKEGGSKP